MACCSTTGRSAAGICTLWSVPSPPAGCGDQDRDHLGQQIIDYFSQRPHDRYEQAKTLDDLRDAIIVVRTLFQIGRKQEAWDAFYSDLLSALVFNMEAYPETLFLLRPFFPHAWSAPSEDLTDEDRAQLANSVAYALHGLGEFRQCLELYQVAIRIFAGIKNWRQVYVNLVNISVIFDNLNRLAPSERYSMLSLRLAEALDSPDLVFRARLSQFEVLAVAGSWDKAEEMWNLLDPMGRDWPRQIYRQGSAEISRLAFLLFPRRCLTEEDLTAVEHLARVGQNRRVIRASAPVAG